jgi:pyruvate-ferredoxin/flavodoxin oxidoreductase
MRVAARRATWDGNEAAVSVAYRLNEVCCIYPITPASPMAELADQWSSEGLANLYGSVPQVIEMQSEAGAAGALHGCLQGGALGTTFTASQGLLLMIPELYKIAGELTPAVLHVAARSVAAQALSIFGDHADVMAVRQSGVALLASSSVQEAHDLAAVAQAATLASRIPFVHFFDGFRTSHELHTIDTLSDDDLRALIDERLIFEHRRRALSPEHPVVRGTSHNPDVAFQARETVNPFYAATPGLVQGAMDQLAARTGRRYHLVDYTGHPAAERVVVLMGSGSETARETVGRLAAEGEAVGALTVRLYRPFPADALRTALPPSVRALAVLDRCKEPGSFGEPLFLDVVAALSERRSEGAAPVVVGGRYGLSSKEFTPGMVAGVLDELATSSPKRRFTVGIVDDVTGTSLHFDPSVEVEAPGTYKAVFHGLGADGTVGATKNTIRILGARGFEAQGYFVYDSKKAGSQTVSHLRCATSPIKAPYLVDHAHFVACHHPELLRRLDVLATAAPGATVLLNWPGPSEEVFEALPAVVQRQVVEKGLRLYAVDAGALARGAGLGGRVNTVLQACFFALSNVVSLDEALDEIKTATARTYARQGQAVVEANLAVVDQALEALAEVEVPAGPVPKAPLAPPVPEDAPVFVRRVTAAMMTGRGDQLPVSALPADGTWPSGTARYEKRNVSDLVAEWDPTTCIQCGQCSFVCPHAVLRSRTYATKLIEDAPKGFPSAPLNARGLPGHHAGQALDEGHQHERAAGGARRGPAPCRLLRDAAPDESATGRLRHRARRPVPRSALRVLGGL